jgi:hypothetical protein
MSDKKPQSQPPPLRLANMGRALRARARAFVKAEQRHHAGEMSTTAAWVEACEASLEEFALAYARAYSACNHGVI